jgi:hypothetical protein
MAAAGRTCLLYRQAPRRRIPATDLRSPRFRRHRDPRTEQLRPCRITAQLRLPRPRVVRARADRAGHCALRPVRRPRLRLMVRRLPHRRLRVPRVTVPRRLHRPLRLTVRRLPHRQQLPRVPEHNLFQPRTVFSVRGWCVCVGLVRLRGPRRCEGLLGRGIVWVVGRGRRWPGVRTRGADRCR